MCAAGFDPRDLRHAFGAFATGVTVVTMKTPEGDLLGFTANSFTSVSLDPPLVLVCLARGAGSYDAFCAADSYAVNILAADQQATSNSFASRGADKFAGVDWQAKATGSPVLDGATAWLDCRMHQVMEAGDHAILIGRVVDYAHTEKAPLGYCRGAYVDFALVQKALATPQARVGAILECDGGLLLEQDDDGRWQLPGAGKLGSAEEPDSLLGTLAADALAARLPFLFAVFEDGPHAHVVYRGTADRRGIPATARFTPFPPDDLPWDQLASQAEASMLRRYLAERQADIFGIYVGTAEAGDIHRVS